MEYQTHEDWDESRKYLEHYTQLLAHLNIEAHPLLFLAQARQLMEDENEEEAIKFFLKFATNHPYAVSKWMEDYEQKMIEDEQEEDEETEAGNLYYDTLAQA